MRTNPKHLLRGFLLILFLVVLVWCWTTAHQPRATEWQAKSDQKKTIAGLALESQTDLDVIASGAQDEAPCPPEYSNVISNTNLFTFEEQNLLKSIPSEYGNVTSNSGPVGSVPIYFHSMANHSWTARFQFTNSDMRDEVTPGGDMLIHKVRNKRDDGYDIRILDPSLEYPRFTFGEIRHGISNGIYVSIAGARCEQWMRFSNGMAVDKWLYWGPGDGKLMIWVKFKEPYNYFQNSRERISPF